MGTPEYTWVKKVSNKRSKLDKDKNRHATLNT